MNTEKSKQESTEQALNIPDVKSSYPRVGDRVQLINTYGNNNLEYGTVIKHREIRLDNGERLYIPDWEHQLRLI